MVFLNQFVPYAEQVQKFLTLEERRWSGSEPESYASVCGAALRLN
jgi:hypothetical protein